MTTVGCVCTCGGSGEEGTATAGVGEGCSTRSAALFSMFDVVPGEHVGKLVARVSWAVGHVLDSQTIKL